jgi:myo-inositol 2-dehydrogenase/D-chiro-inositol 1-dehydrogenase
MTIRVGIIGTGNIGEDHGRKLATVISGAAVTAVTDVDRSRAEAVARGLGGVPVVASGEELIASDAVDAVLVTSSSVTHARYVLAAIAAGKPVLCEKPLAPTIAECERIVAAEVAHGKRLVTVGYMRRYDPGYVQVRAALASGAIGTPLILHNVHRNAALPDEFTSRMSMTESMIHEVDVIRWLLDDEIGSVQVVTPKRSPLAPPGVQDPQFALFTTGSGILATVEFFGTCRYGYDVRCELVGSTGVATLTNPTVASTIADGALVERVPADWHERFASAYTAELRAWIEGLQDGDIAGASAWDGYAATRVVTAGVDAMETGERVSIEAVDRPALYD